MKTRFFPSDAFPVDNFMRDLFSDSWSTVDKNRNEAWSPSANISENANSWRIELAVPGLSKELFKLEVNKNRLTISAKLEEKKEECKYSYREFSTSAFSRSFNLPQGKFNEEGISAKYANGILEVQIPKLEEAKDKGPKTIEIQ